MFSGKDIWNKIRENSLVRDTVTTTALSVAGKGIGFLIPFFIAAWFGVTSQTDLFFFAYAVILFIIGIFTPVAENITVPFIAEIRSEDRDAGAFVGKILTFSTIGLVILAGIFLVLIRPMLLVITHFGKDSLNTAYVLIIEITPLIILSVWSSVLAGSMNAFKEFKFPAISPAFRAVVNLAFIFIFKNKLGVHAIALGYVVGEMARIATLLSAIYKLKLFSLSFSIKMDDNLRTFFKTASYQAVGLVAMGLNPVVDQAMASWLGTGNVSILYYADRIFTIPLTVGISGLSVVLLAEWSKKYYTGQDIDALRRDSSRVIRAVAFISAFATVLLCLFSGWIVKIIYGTGGMPADTLLRIKTNFVFLTLALMPYLIATIVINVHQVLKNTKVIMQWSFFSVLSNIILNLFLMRYLGVAGLALSTTIVSAVSLIYLSKSMYKKFSEIKL